MFDLRKWITDFIHVAKTTQRIDAGETAVWEHALEQLLTRTFDVQYPELKARKFFPVDSSISPGADSFTYHQYDSFGQAKFIASYGDDLPLVNAAVTEFPRKIVGIGVGYSISLQNIRASQMAGVGIDTRLAAAARRAVEFKIDELVSIGDTEAGFTGFLNNATCVASLVTPITGTWSSASADQIIADVQKLWTSIPTATKQIHYPNTLLVDPTSWGYLQRPRASASDKTIAKWLLENLEGCQMIDQWYRLSTANVAGTGARIVAYQKDPMTGFMAIPMEFTMHPPQYDNLAFKVPCEARCGGAVMPYPRAFAYMDGV